jgi:hypothetical protein
MSKDRDNEEVVSDCCGASPVMTSEDLGLCPECYDHCEYVPCDEEE